MRRHTPLPCRSCPGSSEQGERPVARRAGAKRPGRACRTRRPVAASGRSTAQARIRRARGKYWWLRWVIIGVAVAVLAVEVVLVWDQLSKAWKSLLSANWWWVLAAAVAALASMHSFAQIQRTLLKSAGVHVKQWRSEADVLRGQCVVDDDAGRPGAVRDVRLSAATDLGRFAGGGVLAAGHVRSTAGRRPGVAWPGRRLHAWRQQEPAVADLHPRRLRRAARARADRRQEPATDRRHRGARPVVGQLRAGQACRHRAGEVAGDASAAGVGQPEPTRTHDRVQLVVVQLDRRRRLPGIRRVRGGWPPVARRR